MYRFPLGVNSFASGHLGFVCSISNTQRDRRRERDASNGCTVDSQRFLLGVGVVPHFLPRLCGVECNSQNREARRPTLPSPWCWTKPRESEEPRVVRCVLIPLHRATFPPAVDRACWDPVPILGGAGVWLVDIAWSTYCEPCCLCPLVPPQLLLTKKPALNEGVDTLWVALFRGEETGSMQLSSVLKVTQLGGESQDSDTDLSSLLLSHP